MQTFLPYPSFPQSAKALDDKRLGKQRVEAKQILMVLTGDTKHWKDPNAWANHPAVRMWRGCDMFLALYGLYMCDEWIRRGFLDTLRPYFREQIAIAIDNRNTETPAWLGIDSFHQSHRSMLAYKNPTYYSWPILDADYVWPYPKKG
jgi:hypothetical protein